MTTDTTESRGITGNNAITGQYLQFRIPGLLLCIPLDGVERVLPLAEWQAVPGGARFLNGLMNLHGVAIPVIDLAIRLGHQAPRHYTLDTPILLCRSGKRSAGLAVRDILGIVDLGAREAQVHQQFSTGDMPFDAAFDTAAGLTMLVNVDKVLDFRLDQDNDGYADAAAQQLRALG